MNRISAKAEIAKTAIIHDEVEIGEGAVIHDYVVVYPGTVVKAGAEVYDHCVLGKLPTSPGSTARVYSSGYEKTVIGEGCILCVREWFYIQGRQSGITRSLGIIVPFGRNA